ncbi:Alpha/Beta hydrolase protein [Lineolata rhizophorae]|uniref:alcohol O-acetyltransferase n=1 Tax=Lineolata rhizophorae TaxID=578093 RepID=A0A6A6NSE6_9PEZI|nr:Alpha/Beta hydrolase protein [Lineolata rhizophorae]
MGVTGWLTGHQKLNYTHSDKSATIVLKDGKSTSLSQLCKDAIPPCYLNPLFFNGHLHTAWTVLDRSDPPIWYKRHIFESDDVTYDGTFAVDFVVRNSDSSSPLAKDASLPERTTFFAPEEFDALPSDDSKPMLVCLHGLSGGSHEVYLRGVLKPLVGDGANWEACVVNSRGCAMSKITSGVLYNARATWDIRQTVAWLRKAFPNRPLFAAGFSLGANILVNYIAEEGDSCELQAAVVCSNPWNLDCTNSALKRTWLGREVYLRFMASNMKKLVETHAETIQKNSDVDVDRVRKTRYLYEFDREIQCPTWGYPTEGAYYRDASSVDSLLGVRIPLLGVNAEDDPIAAGECIPFNEFKANPLTALVTTAVGGHLSWFEPSGGRWFARAVSTFPSST